MHSRKSLSSKLADHETNCEKMLSGIYKEKNSDSTEFIQEIQ